MNEIRDNHAVTRRLLREAHRTTMDIGLKDRIGKILTRTKLPMDLVVEKIPGATMIEKAKRVHVTRQTMYYWYKGMTRPNKKQARIVASLTGYDADLIRGRV